MNPRTIPNQTNQPIKTAATSAIVPADLASVLDGLAQLKLKHWRDAIEKDWPTLRPADQQCLAASLKRWIETEASERHSSGIQRRIKDAKFIRLQTADQFDFHYNPSTRAIEKDYLRLHQRTLEGNIPRAVFVGNTGLGKTHLGRALGYAACQAGLSVMFTRASQIVNDLATAKAVHNLERELRKYRKPQLLHIDELGYVSMDMEAGNLFFQVISDRHDRGLGTIVTTNFAFGHWNQIFAAESTALVIVERLTANADVFFLEGESYPQYQKRKMKSAKR
jgi:DNA replication protein DnaC